jgi:hypothetical protein
MANATDSNGRISFNAGASTTGLFLDNVSIKEVPTPVGIRSQARTVGSAIHWKGGVVYLTGIETGKFQIIDSRGRSHVVDAVGGQAKTGALPAGVYHVRLLSEKKASSQNFVVVP